MSAITLCSKNPSTNAKTGPVYTTYRPVGPTCPTSCGLAGVCYARAGMAAYHLRRPVTEPFVEMTADGLYVRIACRIHFPDPETVPIVCYVGKVEGNITAVPEQALIVPTRERMSAAQRAEAKALHTALVDACCEEIEAAAKAGRQQATEPGSE
jgi:hypothetical protein